MVQLGLATSFVNSNEVQNLRERLISNSPKNNQEVSSIINNFSSKPDIEESILNDNEKIIKKVFSHNTVEEIFQSCKQASPNKFIEMQFDELKHKSPTSLKISLKQIRAAKDMSLKDELIMEYRMVQNCLESGDFFEGVRAMLVDKDRKPNWKPSTIEEVDNDRVNNFFKTLNDLDLKL